MMIACSEMFIRGVTRGTVVWRCVSGPLGKVFVRAAVVIEDAYKKGIQGPPFASSFLVAGTSGSIATA